MLMLVIPPAWCEDRRSVLHEHPEGRELMDAEDLELLQHRSWFCH